MDEKGSWKSESSTSSAVTQDGQLRASRDLLVDSNIDKPLMVRRVGGNGIRVATLCDRAGRIVNRIDVSSYVGRELTSSDVPINDFRIRISKASRRSRSGRRIHGRAIVSMKRSQCCRSKQPVQVQRQYTYAC